MTFIESVVLSGAIVHTLVPGEAPRALDVLVQDGRIVALSPPEKTAAFPPDARRVDCAGLHFLPGLIDGLVNHDPEHDRLYVASGVTLVVDQGGDLTPAMAERMLAARDRGPGPALFTAGAPMTGASARHGIVLESAEAADEKVRRLLGESALDWIALGPGLTTSTWRKLLDVAHEKHLLVLGPVLASSSLFEALDAKQDGLHHIDALLPAEKAWSEVTLAELAPRVERLAKSGTLLVPTLALHAVRCVEPRTDGPELPHLSPLYVHEWVTDAEQRRRLFTGEKGLELQRTGVAAVALQKELLRALHEQHARLLPGSASPRPWLFPGRALVEELVLWARAGISPSAVLRAATCDAAQHLGLVDRGTLAPGKVADLVAYAGDPEVDVAALRDPKLVVLRGRVLDRKTLDGLLDDLKARQIALQKRVMGREPIELAPPDLPPGTVIARGRTEQRVVGLRVTGEHWAVVRQDDGALVYATRMRTLGGLSTPDTDLVLAQTVKEDRVVAFELVVKSGTLDVTTKGQLAGGVLNVERRVGGQFVRNDPVKDKVLVVDVGSVLTPLLVAHHAREGAFKALFFDDFEPAVGPWELRIDEKETLLVRTHAGFLTSAVTGDGLPKDVKREQGRGIASFEALAGETPAGAWPIPAENRVPSKRDAPAGPR
ncbi:MAG: amidohydrolase family protein [Planctomycetes bacterium]|nr:amidohydrolase family protein [Planctomycetota bacterium]